MNKQLHLIEAADVANRVLGSSLAHIVCSHASPHCPSPKLGKVEKLQWLCNTGLTYAIFQLSQDFPFVLQLLIRAIANCGHATEVPKPAILERNSKSLQHSRFPDDHSAEYQLSPIQFDFPDRTRRGLCFVSVLSFCVLVTDHSARPGHTMLTFCQCPGETLLVLLRTSGCCALHWNHNYRFSRLAVLG